MASKRILFVEQNTDGTIGGSHYCLLYLIQKLDRTKYEPVAMFYEENSLVSRFEDECLTFVKNLRYYHNLSNPVIRKFLNLIKHISHLLCAVSIIMKYKIKLVHLNDTVAGGYDIWVPAATLCRIPCITHERCFPSLKNVPKYDMHLMRRFSKVLSVSNVVRDNLINQGLSDKKVITVYDGIDPDHFSTRVVKTAESIRSEFDIPVDSMLIGLVGNIRYWKGQELLLDSLYHLNSKFPKFTCLFVGDIAKDTPNDLKYKETLVEKSIRYGIKDKIIFTGFRSDVPDIVNALDLQVNASIQPDPFPHVILEGMSLGKVIIATNLGGAVESIDNGVTGFVVPHNDPAILADRIFDVLSDSGLRQKMGIASRERILQFHIDKNVLQSQNIYQELLNE